jgi:hypothetical protein
VRNEARNRRRAAQTLPVFCGLVVALRENFGFLQPLGCLSCADLGLDSSFWSSAATGGDGNTNGTGIDDATELFWSKTSGTDRSNSSNHSGSSGMIQCLQRAVQSLDQQLYFSDREAFGGIEIGDEVYYVLKETPKGSQAAQLRKVDQHGKINTYSSIPNSGGNKKNSSRKDPSSDIKDEVGNSIMGLLNLKGVIVKDVDPHREIVPGLICITSCTENALPSSTKADISARLPPQLLELGLVSFTASDISAHSRVTTALAGTHNTFHPSGGGNQNNNNAHAALPLNKGDEVTFQYQYCQLGGSTRDGMKGGIYVRAVLVTLLRSARELKQKQQLRSLFSSGQQRMQGVIETVRPSGMS